MGIAHRGQPTPAVTPPAALARYHGLWVAVVGDEVVAAESTPQRLVYALSKLDDAVRREAVMQKAHAPSDKILIGMGQAAATRFHAFPYRDEFPPVPGEPPPVPRPTVDVRVESDDLSIKVRALIDTGSPRTVFGRAVADAVGLELGRGVERRRVQLLGREWDAAPAFVTLTLPPFNDMSWETEVLFLLDEVDLPFEGLLGTEGFLDRWVVSFNYYDNQFVVEERDSFRARLPVDVAEEFLEKYDSEWAPPGR